MNSIHCRLRALYTSRLDMENQIVAKTTATTKTTTTTNQYNKNNNTTTTTTTSGSSSSATRTTIHNNNNNPIISFDDHNNSNNPPSNNNNNNKDQQQQQQYHSEDSSSSSSRKLLLGTTTTNTNTTTTTKSSSSSSIGVLTFEKTPYYLVWPHIPQAIIKTCPWKPKIIVMLRNPVDRLYSHYKMMMKLVNTKIINQNKNNNQNMTRNKDGSSSSSLESILNTELRLLHQFGLSNAPFIPEQEQEHTVTNNNNHTKTNTTTSHLLLLSFEPPTISWQKQNQYDSISFRGFGNHRQNQRYLQRGMYVIQLQRWLQYYQLSNNLLVVQYELFKTNPKYIYNQILHFLIQNKTTTTKTTKKKNITTTTNNNNNSPLIDDKQYIVNFSLTNEEFHTIYRAEKLGKPYQQPEQEQPNHQDQENKKKNDMLAGTTTTTTTTTLHPTTRRYLEQFYHPYNLKLMQLLGTNDTRWLWGGKKEEEQ